MSRGKPSRYAQLSDGQRRAIRGDDATLIIHDALNSYVGPADNLAFFQRAVRDFQDTVRNWATADKWTLAFVAQCNLPDKNSARLFETWHSQFKNGFAKFIYETRREAWSLHQFDSALLDEFINWLKKYTPKPRSGGAPKLSSPNTQRKYYGLLCSLLKELIKHKATKDLVAPSLVFPNNPFVGAHDATKQTDILDDHVWHQLNGACREDIEKIRGQVEAGWAILASGAVAPDEDARGRGKYRDFGAALTAAAAYPGVLLPALSEIREANRPLGDALTYIHRFENISMPFYPSVETILPFVLLMAIYSQANTGPLRSLKWRQVEIVEVLERPRVRYRFEKNRGVHQYDRSYALDEHDAFSPYELHAFLKKWTKNIRPLAGKYADNVYIFVTNERQVRAFLSSEDSGTDSDSSWNNAMRQFCKRHGLPAISIGILRNTGLDIVRDVSNDDIRAVQAAGGQKARGTIQRHYDGSGAKRRRHESLSEGMLAQERFYTTGGRRDIRGEPDDIDIGAATPGWGCHDPFDSPIPGEVKGRLCQGFGRCPACEMGKLDTTSGYALARVLQLAEEVAKAQSYLEAPRWHAAFEDVSKKLREKWIPSFVDPAVIEAASRLNLGPIGRLE